MSQGTGLERAALCEIRNMLLWVFVLCESLWILSQLPRACCVHVQQSKGRGAINAFQEG